MRLQNIVLDAIAIAPEELAREELLARLLAIVVLVAGLAIAAAALIHMRRR